MMRSVLIAAVFAPITLSLVNCGSSVDTTPATMMMMPVDDSGLPIQMSDATVPDQDSGPVGPFVTAPHDPLPPMPKHTNKLILTPHLVTATYAGYTYRAQAEEFGGFLVTSNWLTAVGAEFGVTSATHEVGQLTQTAPATITDAQIQTFLEARMTAGDLPAAPASKLNVYMLYFPATTTITDSGGDPMCGMNGSVGYHGAGKTGGIDYAYAVIADCGTGFPDITSTASHELIEAATDPWNTPDDGYFMDFPAPNLWYTDYGDETADMCQYEANVPEGKWQVQRSYSNVAAAAGGSPCVPAVAGEAYVNVSASPKTIAPVAKGGSVVFTITGWSTLRTTPWMLDTGVGDQTDFDPKATLSGKTINNGDTVTVTLTAPAGAKSGDIGSAYVFSGDAGHFWPVAIQVN